MGLFFPDNGMAFGRTTGQKTSFISVAAAHAALLGIIAAATPTDWPADLTPPFTARLIELAPDTPPSLPQPPKKAPKQIQPAPPPILAAKTPATTTDASAFTIAPHPATTPAPDPAPAPAQLSVTAARFDADYLDNPKPVYPHASRRLREEGKVLLRVRVSASGHAESVEIKHSSGFPRLDQSAEEAVSRWRFIPARRGDEAVAAWVQVPITFNLQG